MKSKASRIEHGIEICNTCVRPVDKPYRYTIIDVRGHRQECGCVSECHDVHVRQNTKPNWMAARYMLPKWVTEARAAIKRIGSVPSSGPIKNETIGD